MSKIVKIHGQGIPLKGNDIDTDRIIPARFLRCVTFDGLGEQVFLDDRKQSQGCHSFDQPQFQDASILVVNANFGCGSSREHAPQALSRWGIQAMVGESFAEIFFGNCVALGIPCVTATPELVHQLQEAITIDPLMSITLDLSTLSLQWGSSISQVQMISGPQQMFLSGTWDACGQLLASRDQIHQTADRLPYVAWSKA